MYSVDQRRRNVLRSLAVLAVSGVAGCVSGELSVREVTMPDDFTFDPETVRIRVGQTVRWRNTSAVNHTVTAYEDELPAGASYFASGGFSTERAARNSLDGGLIAPGETYDHEFNVAGTYPYYCIPHEGSGMVGTVEVQ